MRKSTSILILFTCLALVTMFSEGCYYDNAKDLYPIDTVYVNDTLGDSTLNYTYADVSSIFSTNCATSGCHAAGNGAGRQQLTTYAEVKTAVETFSLKLRVENGTMPPGGSISTTDKNTIIEWVNQGYPEN